MSEANSLQVSIEIDGAPLEPSVESVLEEVSVDLAQDLPDMAVLSFRDVGRTVVNDARIRMGTKLKISTTAIGGTTPEVIFLGEVAGVDGRFNEAGTRAVVRGYDVSHRLVRGRHTKSYRGRKDSDLAREIAQGAGIEIGTIDDSGPVHDYIAQINQTDLEFLRARAARLGFIVGVREGKFEFRKPATSRDGPAEGDYQTDNPLQLVAGQELITFGVRLNSAGQVKKVQVRGWDPVKKEPILGEAPTASTSTDLPDKPADVAALFGDASHTSVDKPFRSQAEVDSAAKALAEVVGGALVEAEGSARGNPKLKPGVIVSISAVTDRFSGRYLITRTTHTFDQLGYRVAFRCTGRHDRNLLTLTAGQAHSSTGDGHLNGVACALVSNNDDPEKLGRVKLRFPWLPDDYESDWARMAFAGAGPDSGATFMPEVNDEVLVCFEFGDMQKPYVLGGLFNGVDKPRLGDSLFDNGKVKRRGIVSRKGHRFVLFDDDSKSGVALLTSDNKLKIALKESGTEIHVKSDGTILIESTRDITIKGEANVSVEASGTLTLKGQGGVTINSGGVVDVDGSVIQLN